MMRAWVWLALGLQLGCGGDVGPRDLDGDGHPAELDCDDANPTVWRAVTGYADTDGDGFGDTAQPVTCVGDTTKGWTQQAGDCAPGDATRWRLVPGLYPDADGDGATGTGPVTACVGATLAGYQEQPGAPDCDDGDAEVSALSVVWADTDGDGVGAGMPIDWCPSRGRPPPSGYALTAGDCAPGDTGRWRMLPFTYRDADGDGFAVAMEGTVCSGEQPPPGYDTVSAPEDCDDRNAHLTVRVQRWLDPDGDGYGDGAPVLRCVGPGESAPGETFQGGDCAPGDSTRWRPLYYASRDEDGDGRFSRSAGAVCSGFWLPQGYSSTERDDDCDDTDAARFHVWSVYADEDGDRVGSGTASTVCAGTTLPAGYSTQATDCAPQDTTAWRMMGFTHRDADGDTYTVAQSGEVCAGTALPAGYGTKPLSGEDCDDTNASLYRNMTAYADTDGDGVGAGPATVLCTNGQLPASWSARGTDCARQDATRWQNVTAFHADRDGDGFTAPIPVETLCIGKTLPLPYSFKAVGNDCDDTDVARYRWTYLYRDQDGDGVGATPRQMLCLGSSAFAGWSRYGDDSDDHDAAVQTDEAAEEELSLILDL
ncbi:hypothetical protein D7Y27_14500 [Corallococcus sp. AB004]|uniref:hypothetical protein n=2 Tax=Corallococcus exiguus TaxID=83462 RepID=UPI000EA1E716|nr:hypothetical protein [Corallococcus exiguus]NPD25256.1 hypothetical protein [Corallococcus exiguus]RKI43862.1 hypothetical protein D7Y27_14500 [Corallococcus sp. AB004]